MKKISFLIGLVFLVSSCEDATEIVQDGELNNERLFTSVENMQLVLNEVYDQMTTTNEFLVSSILTDEIAVGDSGFPNETHNFQIFSTNGFAGAIWTQKYRAINRANRLIEGAQLFTPEDSAIDEYNNIIAQARAIRAFAHFQLLVYFSEDISDDEALGVMLVDFVPAISESIPRATNREVFDLIENDLEFAENNLTNSTSGPQNWYFFNQNVINAMRARMYLYRENHVLAEQFADEVINNSGLSLATSTFTLPTGFPLTTDERSQVGEDGRTSFDNAPAGPTQLALFAMDRWSATTNSPDYKKMWVDADQGESIFSLVRPNNQTNFSSVYNTNSSYTGGAPLWDMGRNLFNLFEEELGGGAQDFRRWAFVDRSSTIQSDATQATRGNEVIVIDKYPGKDGSHNSNDLKIFRVSEMHLIKAECRIEAGQLGAAAQQLQQIRQARNYIAGAIVPTPNYSNAEEAYADVIKERYKELCFEGHRYIDLKRIGTKGGVTETNRFITDSENSSATNPLNISVDDFRFTLPIPQDEININPLIQNTGY